MLALFGLAFPRTRTISFAVSGPRVWNDLPPTLRASSTHTRTVPEQTKDNTISLGLRDVTWRFRDCSGR